MATKLVEKSVTAFLKREEGSHMQLECLQSGFAFNHLTSTIIFPLIKVQMVQIGFCYKECT